MDTLDIILFPGRMGRKLPGVSFWPFKSGVTTESKGAMTPFCKGQDSRYPWHNLLFQIRFDTDSACARPCHCAVRYVLRNA